MKRTSLLLFYCLLVGGLFAQVPPGINYQAVARDGDGSLRVEQEITVVFTLRPSPPC